GAADVACRHQPRRPAGGILMPDTDFEQRLGRAMRELVPDFDEVEPAATTPSNVRPLTRRRWVVGASAAALAAAAAAVVVAVLPDDPPRTAPVGGPTSPVAAAPRTCAAVTPYA